MRRFARARRVALCLCGLAACGEPPDRADTRLDAGRAAIERLQCGACHVIPGITNARGKVGPPLTAYGLRVYTAGKFPRDPVLLARWVADAPSLAPQTAMPKVPMSEADARDIAAYLDSLK